MLEEADGYVDLLDWNNLLGKSYIAFGSVPKHNLSPLLRYSYRFYPKWADQRVQSTRSCSQVENEWSEESGRSEGFFSFKKTVQF